MWYLVLFPICYLSRKLTSKIIAMVFFQDAHSCSKVTFEEAFMADCKMDLLMQYTRHGQSAARGPHAALQFIFAARQPFWK